MRRVRWEISPAALLLAALAYFFDASGLVSAIVPAALVHELGHLLALRLCHRRLSRVRVGLGGAELDYVPQLEGAQAILCFAAGPAAGGLYTLCACMQNGDFWAVSGAASFLLTVFNLLPILPLDGGRMLAVLVMPGAARRVSLLTSAALFVGGICLAAEYRSAALLLAGLWLMVCNASCIFRGRGIE